MVNGPNSFGSVARQCSVRGESPWKGKSHLMAKKTKDNKVERSEL